MAKERQKEESITKKVNSLNFTGSSRPIDEEIALFLQKSTTPNLMIPDTLKATLATVSKQLVKGYQIEPFNRKDALYFTK